MKCLLIGYTGAVGKCILREVVADKRYTEIIALGRREFTHESSKVVAHSINFDDPESYAQYLSGIDVCFYSLGTTKALAKTDENFWKIDHDYTINLARRLRKDSPRCHFMYVSSMGANSNSLFLYPKCKGATENDLRTIQFEKLSIFRPGFLEIENERDQSRPLESVFNCTF